MAILNNNPLIGSGGQQGYSINNSLRFRRSASAYLNRTPASSGSQTTWTYSTWFKRGALGSDQILITAGATNNDTNCYITSSNKIYWFNRASATMNGIKETTQVFRDPSAWYHIMLVWDTTQGTASNRMKIYVNGSQVTAFSSSTDPASSTTSFWNSNVSHKIASDVTAGSNTLDGYLTETNFVDGQALTPSSFGETDTDTGSWKPKAYTGTYGTNGFYLKFSDIATTSGSNAGLGKDFSGNANYFNTNNISVTAGTTYDAMIDSPTLTSATVANYATLNPNLRQTGTGQAPTSANLKLTANTTGYSQVCCATIASTSGKFYWEVTVNGGYGGFGIADSNNSAFTSVVCTTSSVTANPGQYTWGWNLEISNGNKQNNNVSTSYGSAASSGDVYMCAVDIDNGKVWWGKNGTWFASGNPASGTNAAFTNVSGNIIPYFSPTDAGGWTQDINFGQRPFSYTPPTGYLALNTFNLPNPTILQGNKYMNAVLYNGQNSPLSVTGLNFQPDMLWFKPRNVVGNNTIYDAVRGVNKLVFPNSPNVEGDYSDGLTSFNSNGFSLASGDSNFNASGYTYVAWAWDANGAGSSNTSGSITSTVSVNTTAGFSVVTYSGTNSASTIGHGLGVAPKMIFVKTRSGTENWNVYHASIGNGSNGLIYLNLTNAAVTGVGTWNNTAPTSSVFSVTGNNLGVNQSGQTYVAYCWAEIAGFSKFGSYTGNGSADGTFVYTGFRPKFILYKNSSFAGTGWAMLDSSRNTYNVINARLFSDSSGAEDTSVSPMDFTSNGFKVRSTNDGVNRNADTIIYMAFAENPFKNSLAR
jgi:hypothetical protein